MRDKVAGVFLLLLVLWAVAMAVDITQTKNAASASNQGQTSNKPWVWVGAKARLIGDNEVVVNNDFANTYVVRLCTFGPEVNVSGEQSTAGFLCLAPKSQQQQETK